MSWLKHFPKFNERRVWNKNVLGEGGGGRLLQTLEYTPYPSLIRGIRAYSPNPSLTWFLRACAPYVLLIRACESLLSSIRTLKPISIRQFLYVWATALYSEHAQFMNKLINKRSGRLGSTTHLNFFFDQWWTL